MRAAVARIVLFALLMVSLGELSLRVYQRIEYGVPLTAWIPDLAERQFVLSPFLVFGPRLNWYVPSHEGKRHAFFNGQGFRTPEPVGSKLPGEYRIIALGGSTTEDLWNDAGIHWPLVTECRLRQAGREDVRVLNAGMSAYSSAHSLVRLQFDILAFEPDMVLVMHNINDLTVNYVAAARRQKVDVHYLVKYGQRSYTGLRRQEDVVLSRLWSALKARIEAVRSHGQLDWDNYDLAVGQQVFGRNLANIAALGKAHGIAVVLLTMPEADSDSLYLYTETGYRQGQAAVGPLPRDRQRFVSDFEAYNAVVQEVGVMTGVPVVPMHTLMDRSEQNFVDVVHLSTAGTLVFGTTVARELLPALSTPEVGSGWTTETSCDWEREQPR